MNSPSIIERKHELLATAVALVFAYYSLQACLFLPAFREMYSDTDTTLRLDTQVVIEYPGIVATSVAVVAAITLWAIWSRRRLAGLIAAIGIVSLGVGMHVLWSAATSPIFKMINTMSAE